MTEGTTAGASEPARANGAVTSGTGEAGGAAGGGRWGEGAPDRPGPGGGAVAERPRALAPQPRRPAGGFPAAGRAAPRGPPPAPPSPRAPRGHLAGGSGGPGRAHRRARRRGPDGGRVPGAARRVRRRGVHGQPAAADQLQGRDQAGARAVRRGRAVPAAVRPAPGEPGGERDRRGRGHRGEGAGPLRGTAGRGGAGRGPAGGAAGTAAGAAPRLRPVMRRAVDRFLTVPDPKLAVLRDTPRLFLAVRIHLTGPA